MSTDVLIVGAGPTGLALAVQLIRYGIDFIIIDKKETTTPHSKAIGVQARSLEIYEQIGLADKLIGFGAIAQKARMIVDGKVRGQIEFAQIGRGMSPYPYVLIVEQGKHEALLYDYLRSNDRGVRWQTELENFTQHESGVTAYVKHLNGQAETIEAKFLIGCDGAKSMVRHALGLQFEGSTLERMFYVADVDIDWEFSHDALQVCLMKNALLAFFPMGGEHQWRIVGTFPEEFAKDEGDVLYEEIEERIKIDSALDIDITKVNWFSTYKVHTRHVNKFSVGRCLLAGDSAHIHTPAGAQGMNTGIQDGYNLAWKLALLLKGRASLELLNTYNEERLPNADNLTKTTDRFFDLVASPNPVLSFTRRYIFPYVANAAFGMRSIQNFVFPLVSQIGINYRNGSLSAGYDGFKVKAGDRMPYFEIEGASIYDRLRAPVFHLLDFYDGKTNLPPLPEDLLRRWSGLLDSFVIPLYPNAVEIFGTNQSFFILLRPDNHIALISNEFSSDLLRKYLDSISGVRTS